MIGSQKHVQLSWWKRLILIASILLGGSLTTLVPTQAAYASVSQPQGPFICRAGSGGNGGVANNGSDGGFGALDGDCTNGPHGGRGGAVEVRNSPGSINTGGHGGNVY